MTISHYKSTRILLRLGLAAIDVAVICALYYSLVYYRYDEAFADAAVTPPSVDDPCSHVYHQYTLRSDQRDAIRAALADAGVGSGVYYPIPLHLQPCFRELGHPRGAFPVAERAAREPGATAPFTPTNSLSIMALKTASFADTWETNRLPLSSRP